MTSKSRRSCAAIDDLDGFAARVAHDLRGPLVPLLAESTWLERAPVPDTLRGHGERIARSVRRLSAMIDALLRFARAGAARAERVRTPVNATVGEVVGELEETARARGAHIETQLGPEAAIECEANLFQSLVANLIENALKYGAKEGAAAHITVRTQVRDSSSVLEVEDRGPGIPDQLRRRVFEPLFRGHKEGRGIGLGLAIVKRLVDAHDGRIELLPGAQGGALFRVVLPLPAERSSAAPRAAAAPLRGRRVASVLRNWRQSELAGAAVRRSSDDRRVGGYQGAMRTRRASVSKTTPCPKADKPSRP